MGANQDAISPRPHTCLGKGAWISAPGPSRGQGAICLIAITLFSRGTTMTRVGLMDSESLDGSVGRNLNLKPTLPEPWPAVPLGQLG